MTMAFWVAVHQSNVQFCSNGVAGTIIAPAFGLFSDDWFISRTMPIFRIPPRKSSGSSTYYDPNMVAEDERDGFRKADFPLKSIIKRIACFLSRVLCSAQWNRSPTKPLSFPQ